MKSSLLAITIAALALVACLAYSPTRADAQAPIDDPVALEMQRHNDAMNRIVQEQAQLASAQAVQTSAQAAQAPAPVPALAPMAVPQSAYVVSSTCNCAVTGVCICNPATCRCAACRNGQLRASALRTYASYPVQTYAVQAYAAHENATLAAVAKLRSQSQTVGSIADRGQTEQQMAAHAAPATVTTTTYVDRKGRVKQRIEYPRGMSKGQARAAAAGIQ